MFRVSPQTDSITAAQRASGRVQDGTEPHYIGSLFVLRYLHCLVFVNVVREDNENISSLAGFSLNWISGPIETVRSLFKCVLQRCSVSLERCQRPLADYSHLIKTPLAPASSYVSSWLNSVRSLCSALNSFVASISIFVCLSLLLFLYVPVCTDRKSFELTVTRLLWADVISLELP